MPWAWRRECSTRAIRAWPATCSRPSSFMTRSRGLPAPTSAPGREPALAPLGRREQCDDPAVVEGSRPWRTSSTA